MKKLLLLAVVGLLAWQLYEKKYGTSDQFQENASPPVFETPSVDKIDTENFSCDGRQHCSQMNSRAEAEFFLKNCPNTKMDGDHDGVPCENDSRW